MIATVLISVSMNLLIKLFNLNNNNKKGAIILIKIFKTVFIFFQQFSMIGIMLFVTSLFYKYIVIESNFNRVNIYIYIVFIGLINLRVTSFVSLTIKSSFASSFNLHKELINDGCILFNSFFRFIVFGIAGFITFFINLSAIETLDLGISNQLVINFDIINYGLITLIAFDQFFENALNIPKVFMSILKKNVLTRT